MFESTMHCELSLFQTRHTSKTVWAPTWLEKGTPNRHQNSHTTTSKSTSMLIGTGWFPGRRSCPLPQAFVRNVVKLLGGACVFLGWLVALKHPARQTWHDQQTHSVVLAGATATTPDPEDADPTRWQEAVRQSWKAIALALAMAGYSAWVGADLMELLRGPTEAHPTQAVPVVPAP